MNFASNVKNGANANLPTHTRRVTNRGGATAVAVGDLMSFDLAAADTDTSSGNGPNGSTGHAVFDACWLNIINPIDPTLLITGCYCIVTDLLDGAGADNTDVEVAIQGYVQAFVFGTDFTTRGAALTPTSTTANRNLIAHADVAGNRPVGFIGTPNASSAASTEQLTLVAFYGWGNLFGGAATV